MAYANNMASLKAAAEDKSNGDVSKVTSFAVNPQALEVEEGFNARPLNTEHVAERSLAWRSGAVFPPLEVRVEEGRILIVDGHHRHAAVLDAIAKGAEIKSIDVRQFRGNDADRVAHMITSAGGLPLTPLQLGIQYRKLIGFGWTDRQVAARVGKSIEHVRNMVLLGEANSDVHQAINAGEISGTAAVILVKEHGSKAGKVIQDGLKEAQANGKTKVTTKTLAKQRRATAPSLKVTLEWIPVGTELPDADITVLAAFDDGDVHEAFRDDEVDDETWRFTNGKHIRAERVLYWAHKPAAPSSNNQEKTLK